MIAHIRAQMSTNAHKCASATVCAMAAIALILVLASPGYAITLDFDGAEYTATTAETITVAWDRSLISINGQDQACSDCEYEVRTYHVERKSYVDSGKTTQLTRSVRLTRTGHYVIEVRACRNSPAGSDPSRVCSDWAASANEASRPTVDGTLRKWRIYGRPAPGGDIVVGQ